MPESDDDDETEGLPAPDFTTPRELETRVPMAWQGQRLDRVLAQWQPDVSRSHLQQLIEEGELRLEGEVCQQPSRKLRLGQRLQLNLRPPAAMLAFVPEAMNLVILHEDAALMVIDKPAGLVVHPAAGNWTGTLMNGLLAHHAAAAALPRAGIVHRLDKDTAGLMVVAKTPEAYAMLVAQLAAREVKREYLALCKGAWPEDRLIDAPVGRDPRTRTRMAVVPVPRGGKSAQTQINALAVTNKASLLHCQLHTGRTHQIRVHCAHTGHPLLGDALYGGPVVEGLGRQALHAVSLQLRHPSNGDWLKWSSEPPPDFHQAASVFGLPVELP